MATKKLTPEEAIQEINNFKPGQMVTVDYYGKEEPAYFIDNAQEPENDSKILVVLEDQYQPYIADAKAGEVTNMSDEFPYSADHFKLISENTATVTASINGQAPEVRVSFKPLFEKVYDDASFVLNVAGEDDYQTEENFIKAHKLGNEILADNRAEFVAAMGLQVDLKRAVKDIEGVLNLKSNPSTESAETSESEELQGDDIPFSESELDDLVFDKEDSPFAATPLSDDELLPSLDVDQDVILPPTSPVDRQALANDAINQHANVSEQAGVAAYPNASFGVVDAAAALTRGLITAPVTFVGDQIANVARLASEKGNEAFANLMSEKPAQKFANTTSVLSTSIAKADDAIGRLNNGELSSLIDTARSDPKDIDAARNKKEALAELSQSIEDSIAFSDLKDAFNSIETETGQLNDFIKSHDDVITPEMYEEMDSFSRQLSNLKDDSEVFGEVDSTFAASLSKAQLVVEALLAKLKDLSNRLFGSVQEDNLDDSAKEESESLNDTEIAPELVPFIGPTYNEPIH